MQVELINSDGFSLGIYTDINLINKLKLDGAVEVPICEQNFHIKFWDGTKWIEGISSEDILNNNLEKETQKYIQRSKDGLEAYARISAEFRLAKQSGQLSEETHAYIEKTLIPVRNEVLAGQWISGLNELVSIGPEIIGQDLYDRLFNQISAYIEVNYSLIEQQVSKIQTSKSK